MKRHEVVCIRAEGERKRGMRSVAGSGRRRSEKSAKGSGRRNSGENDGGTDGGSGVVSGIGSGVSARGSDQISMATGAAQQENHSAMNEENIALVNLEPKRNNINAAGAGNVELTQKSVYI